MKVFQLIGPFGNHWNFLGPENLPEEAFRDLCSQLFPEAAETAFAENQTTIVNSKEILGYLAELLIIQGFKPCEIITANHHFPPPDVLLKMNEHNSRVSIPLSDS